MIEEIETNQQIARYFWKEFVVDNPASTTRESFVEHKVKCLKCDGSKKYADKIECNKYLIQEK